METTPAELFARTVEAVLVPACRTGVPAETRRHLAVALEAIGENPIRPDDGTCVLLLLIDDSRTLLRPNDGAEAVDELIWGANRFRAALVDSDEAACFRVAVVTTSGRVVAPFGPASAWPELSDANFPVTSQTPPDVAGSAIGALILLEAAFNVFNVRGKPCGGALCIISTGDTEGRGEELGTVRPFVHALQANFSLRPVFLGVDNGNDPGWRRAAKKMGIDKQAPLCEAGTSFEAALDVIGLSIDEGPKEVELVDLRGTRSTANTAN